MRNYSALNSIIEHRVNSYVLRVVDHAVVGKVKMLNRKKVKTLIITEHHSSKDVTAVHS